VTMVLELCHESGGRDDGDALKGTEFLPDGRLQPTDVRRHSHSAHLTASDHLDVALTGRQQKRAAPRT
jgi:hypothetical protein